MRILAIFIILAVQNLAVALSTQVYFSPQDKLAERLIELIDKEKESIQAAIYCFTHRDIAKALVAAKERGVSVELIVDPYSIKTRAPLAMLSKGDVSVYVWNAAPVTTRNGKKGRAPIMHDKFCIFGGKRVWTGSFNFTYEASRSNAENALVLDDEKIVAAFKEQFESMKTNTCLSYEEHQALKNAKMSTK